jgi:16S rRNA (cytosine1402-N4)-methyltransferase
LSEAELINIFRKFGEERYANRVVRYVVEERKDEPISTTTQLVDIILRALPLKSRGYRIHPATRIFQALRIAVNRELEALTVGLEKAMGLLNKKGRLAVISFHSLEDRIAKHMFKDFASKGIVKIITKKPLLPSQAEIDQNAASRSAKLRVVEKMHL